MININVVRHIFYRHQERHWINNFMILLIVLVCVGWGFTGYSLALPTLQLDIEGGYYDSVTQTIVTTSDQFTLSAFLVANRYNTINDHYYISAALMPKEAQPGGDYGSFSLSSDRITVYPDATPYDSTNDGDSTVEVTGEMVFGIPPLDSFAALQGWDSGDLPSHSIYKTYFAEFEFKFDPDQQIAAYNTQDGSPAHGQMYNVEFDVDLSNLMTGYDIHFDLYNTKLCSKQKASCNSYGDIDITQFAPFSHDAESRRVPEPSTLLLLGSGIMGLGLLGRRINKK